MARRRSRKATEEALLDATISLVAELGINGFTLSDVANRAGVNRALIYHYFSEREKLIEKATDRALQRTQEGRPGVPLLTPEQLVDTFTRDPELDRFFLRFLLEPSWPAVLRDRLTVMMRRAADLEARHGSESDFEMVVVVSSLTTVAWRCARQQYAELLGVSVQEADRRFIEAFTGQTLTSFWQAVSESG